MNPNSNIGAVCLENSFLKLSSTSSLGIQSGTGEFIETGVLNAPVTIQYSGKTKQNAKAISTIIDTTVYSFFSVFEVFILSLLCHSKLNCRQYRYKYCKYHAHCISVSVSEHLKCHIIDIIHYSIC